MCSSETPPGERAMCGCYSRRAISAVVAAVVVIGVALALHRSVLVIAVAATVAASVAVVALAMSRQPGFSGIVHRYTPPVSPAVSARLTLEDTPDRWWERARTGENGAQR